MENMKKKKIAIFTDVHGLKEPLEAIIYDAKQRGVDEIISLGDNIGEGPNSGEVIDMMEDNHVISIAGNSEDYVTLGLEPFASYMHGIKAQGANYTNNSLTMEQKGIISLYPHSVDLVLGGKKLSLCHFANDVRFDFEHNSTWSYQNNINFFGSGYNQFLNTNSDRQKEYLKNKYDEYMSILSEIKKGDTRDIEKLKELRGVVSAYNEPLFCGKPVSFYDAIIEGHVHFRIFEDARDIDTKFYTLRAAGMGYSSSIRGNSYDEPNDKASYVILTEKDDGKGFDYEEILVPFDRESMLNSIKNSNNPNKNIEKFVGFRR